MLYSNRPSRGHKVIYLAGVNSLAWGFSLASRARSELPAPAAPYTLYIIANPRAHFVTNRDQFIPLPVPAAPYTLYIVANPRAHFVDQPYQFVTQLVWPLRGLRRYCINIIIG